MADSKKQIATEWKKLARKPELSGKDLKKNPEQTGLVFKIKTKPNC